MYYNGYREDFKIKKAFKKAKKATVKVAAPVVKKTVTVAKDVGKTTVAVAKDVVGTVKNFDEILMKELKIDQFISTLKDLNKKFKEFFKVFEVFKEMEKIKEIPDIAEKQVNKLGDKSQEFLEKMFKILIGLLEDFILLIFDLITVIFKIFKKTFIYDILVILFFIKVTMDISNQLYTISSIFNFGARFYIIGYIVNFSLLYAGYMYITSLITPENVRKAIVTGIKEGIKESAKLIEALFNLFKKGIKKVI